MNQMRGVMDRLDFVRNVNNWTSSGTKGVRIRGVLIFLSCSLPDVDSYRRELTF